jgi:hypothetical protein
VKHSAVITDPDPLSLIESGSGSSNKLLSDSEHKCDYNRTVYFREICVLELCLKM